MQFVICQALLMQKDPNLSAFTFLLLLLQRLIAVAAATPPPPLFSSFTSNFLSVFYFLFIRALMLGPLVD